MNWLEKLGLKEWRNKKASELSKGMQAKGSVYCYHGP